ncbi:hypothetical protein LB505_012686 [Fusarium chuoi]|nr:hypothetical protein LB505_012686 [Fusarium chuoi]
MATGPGLNAAKILQDEGISTLGTGVFSVAQAVACSQAGCLYISPYYNGPSIGASIFASYRPDGPSIQDFVCCHRQRTATD